MIRINLLPEEYRKKARTPLKLMLGISAGVAINGGLIAWWAWLNLAVAMQIDNEKSLVQSEMDGLKPQLDYFASLDGESKQYKSREQTLSAITKSRLCWTKKLDEFVDVCNRGGDGERHLVWFDDFQVTQNLEPKAKSTGSVRASGHSGSDKFAQVANFLEDLESSSFIADFDAPSSPEGSQSMVDETLVPPVAWAFPLALSMRNFEERDAEKAAEQAAKDAKDPNAKIPPADAKHKPADSTPTPTPTPAPTPDAGTKKAGGQ